MDERNFDPVHESSFLDLNRQLQELLRTKPVPRIWERNGKQIPTQDLGLRAPCCGNRLFCKDHASPR